MKPVIPEKIDLTVPGPVPKEPPFILNSCNCDHCKEYKGTFEKDPDMDFPNTPDFIQ